MLLLKNSKAMFEYEIQEKYSAGIVLRGHEVKSLRGKHGSLAGTFVRIIGLEAWLINAQIPLYKFATVADYDPRRMRKLLLHKREILKLQQVTQQKGKALIPLAIVVEKNNIKLEFGVGKGRQARDKRAVIKKREMDRQLAAAMKQRH